MRTHVGILASIAALVSCVSLQAAEQPRDHIRFVKGFASECLMHQGDMLLIKNTHAELAIDVYLEPYLGGVLQPGRSVTTVKPKSKPVELGCTQHGGLGQRWEIVKAEIAE